MKKKSFIVALGFVIGWFLSSRMYDRIIVKLKDENNKKQEFYDVFCNWMKLHNSGYRLEQYFIENGFSEIAIYGMKELGELLYDELSCSNDVKIKCTIDRNSTGKYKKIDIYSPDDVIPEVDVIVVTAIHYYNEIEDQLKHKVSCPIVSLEDIVYGI